MLTLPTDALTAVQQLVHRGDWLALDTETTGLEAHDQVVDVALLDAEGRVLFESLSQPTVPFHPEVPPKTGLSDARVAGAPTWPEVWKRLGPLLEGREVVAFNAAFDSSMIEGTCRAHGLTPARVKWTCARRLLSPLWSRDRVSLRQVCLDLGIEPGTHRAKPDVEAMIRALRTVASRPLTVRPFLLAA